MIPVHGARAVFAFRYDGKFNDIHTKRGDDIIRGVRFWSGGARVLQMSTFSTQFRQPVLFHRLREPNKTKRKGKLGGVMEMLRKISSPPLSRTLPPGGTPSLLRCDEPWKTLILSSNRARDSSRGLFFLLAPPLFHRSPRRPPLYSRLSPFSSYPNLFSTTVRFTLAVSARSKVYRFAFVALPFVNCNHGSDELPSPSFLSLACPYYTLIIIYGACFAWCYDHGKLTSN